MAPLIDVKRVREDFPMFRSAAEKEPFIYLDTAATAQKPAVVIDTMATFYALEYGTVHRASYTLAAHATERYTAARGKVQRFIGARSEEEIVFTRGTTESINLVAHCYGRPFLSAGDEIILSEMEHHANIVPWQLLAQEKHLQLKYIPMSDQGELCMDSFRELLTDRTKLVSIAHIANATGTVNPIQTIIEWAHQVGAKVLVDGAQAISHLPVNVQALGADFYAFSGHKMYGPTGIGVLYGKQELLEEMPPFMGGGDSIVAVTLTGTTFQMPPLRFESGTPPIAEVIGLGAAIDYIESLGRESIERWLRRLTQYAMEKLLLLPELTLIGSSTPRGPILSLALDTLHPLDLGTFLNVKRIAIRTGHLCAQPTLARLGRSSLARLSFGVYNTLEEIDMTVRAIQEGLVLLKPECSF